MYENRHGRFTAVDPLLASGKSANPQTFNRFVYVGSNPLVRIDPTGEEWIIVYNIVKVKETVKTKNGKSRTVEKTVELRMPKFVKPGEMPDVPRISGVFQDTYGEEQGFVALHPTANETSDFFKTREEAQAVYDQWMRGTEYNPIVKVAVFDTSIFSRASSLFVSPTGHVANAINDETYSWDNSGYTNNQNTSFDMYLRDNFSYRSGTVFEFDFGSPEANRSAAREIRLGPRNGSANPFFSSGYNMLSNNCGETMCRLTENLNLPRDNTIAPFQHRRFIERNLGPFITNRRRVIYTPPNPFTIPPIPRPVPLPTPKLN